MKQLFKVLVAAVLTVLWIAGCMGLPARSSTAPPVLPTATSVLSVQQDPARGAGEEDAWMIYSSLNDTEWEGILGETMQ